MDTLEEVKQILKQIALDRDRENKQREAERMQREAERKQREAERALENKQREAEHKKREAELKELHELQKEGAKRSAAIDKQLKELGIQIGGLGNKFGSFTEGMAYNSMRKILLEKYGIENTAPRFSKKLDNGFYLEYDVFGYTNGKNNKAAIVEVKSHLRAEDIDNFVDKLKEFKQRFPDHRNKQLHGIIATVDIITNEIRKLAWKQGLHLANIHEEVFTLIENPKPIDFNRVE